MSILERYWQRLRGRLLRLALLAVIVGGAVGGLYAAGILGDEGGETVTVQTEQGERTVVIEPARLLATRAPAGVAVSDIGPREGRLAPDFEFSSVEGERIRLSDLRGHPVFLNFWASWCGPCREEMPDIQRLQERYEGEGLIVLSLNRGERLSRTISFLDEVGVEFAVEGMDPSQEVYREYLASPVEFMPLSVFIDEDGVVGGYHPGFITMERMEELYARISSLPVS